jgi:putative inorganic carbon (HCO3(-)) transporter
MPAGKFARIARSIAAVEPILLLAVAPLFLFPGRWTVLGLATIAVGVIARRVATARSRTPALTNLPLAVVFATATIGLLVAPRHQLAIPKFCGLVLGLALYFALVNRAWTTRGLHVAGLGIALASVGLVSLAIVGTDWRAAQLVRIPAIYAHLPTLVQGVPNSGVPRTSELFNPREVGGTLALLVPLLAALACFNRGYLRLCHCLALLVTGSAALLTQATSAIAGILVAIPLIVIASWGRNSPVMRRAAIALAAVFPAVAVVSLLCVTLASVGTPAPLAPYLGDNAVNDLWQRGVGRLGYWESGRSMLQAMPLTGIGLNNFTHVYQRVYPSYPTSAQSSAHAHNFLLQTALDLGLPGALAFIVLQVLVGRNAVRSIASLDRQRQGLVLGGLGGLAAHAIFGLTDAVTLGAKPGLLLWTVVGLLVAAVGTTAANLPPRRLANRWPPVPSLRITAAALALLLIPLLSRVALVNLAAAETSRAYIGAPGGPNGAGTALVPGPVLTFALGLFPDSPQLQRQRGLLALAGGDPATAIPALERALRGDGNNATRGFLGDALYAADRRDEAAITWQGGNPWLALAKATDLARTGDNDRAARLYRSARQRDTGLSLNYCTREAAALDAGGTPSEAIPVYRSCIQLSPERPGPYVGLATLLVRLGDREGARATLEEGVRHAKPPSSPAHQLAGMWLADNRPDLAEPLASLAVRESPATPDFTVRLGDVYAQQARYELAIAQYNRAAALGDSSVWRWLAPLRIGDVYLRQGQAQRAADQYRRTLADADGKLTDTRALAHYYVQLANATLRVGDRAGAVAALERALTLNPDNRAAREQLAALQTP